MELLVEMLSASRLEKDLGFFFCNSLFFFPGLRSTEIHLLSASTVERVKRHEECKTINTIKMVTPHPARETQFVT